MFGNTATFRTAAKRAFPRCAILNFRATLSAVGADEQNKLLAVDYTGKRITEVSDAGRLCVQITSERVIGVSSFVNLQVTVFVGKFRGKPK